ncbi:signal peptidase I [Lysinibacillus pakistanensis]|uniref:Signal peptidase I n=1 Tax=Lysinibacillus pakistanensis TaxID=759811 RepID=A0AAX3WTC7_9BACI|nr:signal peptidase I [Lysinibacillus pakistanensis]MDM5234437.1 signal peptidase I [Lysinibacillus pakistanensis]WHY45020.1 signal peptidase I [Lysinibacillus pakistanensis]WHY50028.1 signal peptidase I [Lysinibacillus pakistanensis]
MAQKQNQNELWAWIKAIGFAIIFTMGIRYFIFSPVVVEGASMMPTFENGDKVIVNKVGPKISSYQRFDVIVFKANEEENYIKRIIGLPGDHIAYKDDVLYINGKAFEEPYLIKYKEALLDKGDFTYDFTLEEQLGEMIVPEGHFFVLGDNRRRSIDSRDQKVGFVAQHEILGTAGFVLWPFDRIGSTH